MTKHEWTQSQFIYNERKALALLLYNMSLEIIQTNFKELDKIQAYSVQGRNIVHRITNRSLIHTVTTLFFMTEDDL